MTAISRLFGALIALSVGASVAGADTGKRAVILPAQINGWFPMRQTLPADLELHLANGLRAMRISVVKVPLTAKESTCGEDECLTKIAVDHKVDYVVLVRLMNDEQTPPSYHGSVRVAVLGTPPETRVREKECPSCSLLTMKGMLTVALNEAVSNSPVTPPTKIETPPRVEKNPPNDGHPTPPDGKPKAPPDLPPSIDPKFRPALIAVGAVGVAGILASTIALIAKGVEYHSCSSPPTGLMPPGCAYLNNTTPGIGGSIGGLAVGIVLTGVGFGLLPKTRPTKQLTLSPIVGGNSTGATLSGTF